jgi:type II secretory pathway predicted ATPase ExeA
MSDFDLSPDDHSPDAEEVRQTYRRRLFMYSSKALAAGLPAERIFVTHPAFKAALEALDRIYQLAVDSTVPQGAMLIGETGTGKSSLIHYYKQSMPPSMLFEVNTGALILRLQERPYIGRVVGTLLRLMQYPFSQVQKNTVSLKKDIVIDALKQKGTRMILVDEAHHLCHARKHGREQFDGTETTEYLRELMDECRIGLVLCGTSALDGLRDVDRHLHARVTGRFELHNFDVQAQFQGFIKAFAAQCKTFELAGIHSADFAKSWMTACKGNPRAFKRLAVESILVAIDTGRTALDMATIATAFDRVAGKDSLVTNPFREQAA